MTNQIDDISGANHLTAADAMQTILRFGRALLRRQRMVAAESWMYGVLSPSGPST